MLLVNVSLVRGSYSNISKEKSLMFSNVLSTPKCNAPAFERY